MAQTGSYEGLQSRVRELPTPPIEVWENQYADREYTVDLDVPELTCICPKTGLPDFGRLRVIYVPRRWCLELKSFKMYVTSFRRVGIFHEHLVNKVLDDIVRACRPRRARVSVVMNPRGGIVTSVEAVYPDGRTRPRRGKEAGRA